MTTRIVLSGALLLAALPVNCFAQAATESALAHSASGTAASRLSSDLGKTLTQGINHVSGRIQQQLNQSPANSKGYTFSPAGPKRPAVSSAPAVSSTPAGQMAPTNPTGQPVIASIQGGIQCSPSTTGNCQIAAKRSNNTNQSVIQLK